VPLCVQNFLKICTGIFLQIASKVCFKIGIIKLAPEIAYSTIIFVWKSDRYQHIDVYWKESCCVGNLRRNQVDLIELEQFVYEIIIVKKCVWSDVTHFLTHQVFQGFPNIQNRFYASWNNSNTVSSQFSQVRTDVKGRFGSAMNSSDSTCAPLAHNSHKRRSDYRTDTHSTYWTYPSTFSKLIINLYCTLLSIESRTECQVRWMPKTII